MMEKSMRDYTEIDAAILKQIDAGCATLSALVDSLSDKVKPFIIKSKSPFVGSVWRVIDRRLQALRKGGIIKYNRADCRWCVNKSVGSD